MKVAVFADAGSLWDYRGPTTLPATGEVLSGNLCAPGARQQSGGAVSSRQRDARPLLGRRRLDLGFAVRSAALRLRVPAAPKSPTIGSSSSGSAAGRGSDRTGRRSAVSGGMTEPLFFKRAAGLTVGEIADLTGAEPRAGADLDRRITRIAPLDRAGPRRSHVLRQRQVSRQAAARFARPHADAPRASCDTSSEPRQRASCARALSRICRRRAQAVSGGVAAILALRSERDGGQRDSCTRRPAPKSA